MNNTLTPKEIVLKLRSLDSWTEENFKEVKPLWNTNFPELRQELVKAGIWERFDHAYCEWEMPGQAKLVKDTKVVCNDGKAKPLGKFKPIKAVTAAELDKMDIPPIEWLVEETLPVGISMIGAPSKYYKSYMALGLCIAICTGTVFLNYKCQKHACLYLDLESTKRRPRNRINQIMGNSANKPDNLYIIDGTEFPGRIGDGFEAQIEYQLQEHPEIKLIVIDVFQMIRQPAKNSQTGYDRDYEDFQALKEITDRHNIGILLSIIHEK